MFHDSAELAVGPVRSEWTFDILNLTAGIHPPMRTGQRPCAHLNKGWIA